VRLLVSVRSPDEVAASLEGGADIIDAKEPRLGALGPVAPDVLTAIDGRVPLDVPLSVALGDAASARSVDAVIAGLPLRPRARLYLKLAFTADAGELEVAMLLCAATGAAARHAAAPSIIAVVYADGEGGEPAAYRIRRAARRAGVGGILVDTAGKDGRTLLDWWSFERLRDWVRGVHADGLEAALAGSLGATDLGRIADLGPDVVGVRGAACAGGRTGSVEAARVRALRAAIPRGPGVIAANDQTDRLPRLKEVISK
jgi:(5-formylfuran-3-yl)methyl phosphate synthase